jgi:hypothetical protein
MRTQNKILYSKEYYIKNKDKILKYSKENYLRTKEIVKLRHKKRYYNNNNLPSIILERAKRRSKKYNLPFNIDISDIIIPEFCPVLEIKLERNYGGSANDNSPSLDKIIPYLGYVKGNIRVISHKANTMKNNATEEELKLFCKNIINHAK